MGRVIDLIFRLVTIAALGGLLGSYTAPYTDPNVFAPSSLLGLAYHYLLIANLLLFLYWLFRRKKMAIVVLVVIGAGYPFLRTYYGLNAREVETEAHDLSVLSYNVRQMSLYRDSEGNGAAEGISRYLEHFDGDIAFLQEFPAGEKELRDLPSYRDSYRYRDVAILSRHPLRNEGHLSFPKGYSAACIYADVVLPTDTLRLYCVHLESYRLGRNEIKIYKDLKEGNSEDISEGVHTLLRRLVVANKNRAKEATLIKRHMETSPYPIILCGDFNDTPLSYTYHVLRDEMKDSFIEKGRGLGNTYIGEFPSFRIDYILHSPELETAAYARDTILYSDHYAIQSQIRLK